MADDPRATLAQLVDEIRTHLGARLLGLYLSGSLASGSFVAGQSDLDLVAVLESEIGDDEIAALRAMHEDFEAARPDWRDRIEVLYLSRAALQTFGDEPRGRVVRISPGEPLHHRELDGNLGWLLDWHGALKGEALFGPPPSELGPDVEADRFRAAVLAQLHEMQDTVRTNSVAYVPAQQGYIVATVCRALYSLATDEQTSKERAVTWFTEQRPELADFVWGAYDAYRADVRGPHERLIQFVDESSAEAAIFNG